jgi:catechol 2,3-dioxygenase-like lactoylglutathione lyase family enzyme
VVLGLAGFQVLCLAIGFAGSLVDAMGHAVAPIGSARGSAPGEGIVKITAVVETAIYVNDLQATEAFYGTVLGLGVMGKEPGRHVFFQVGEANVLLAFIAETTLEGDHLPPHGAKGPGHFALGIDADALDAWRQKLQESGVVIEQEVEWPRGGKSIYFRDPAGNSVELITPGVWELQSGW